MIIESLPVTLLTIHYSPFATHYSLFLRQREQPVHLIEVDREAVAVREGERRAVIEPGDQRLQRRRRRRVVDDRILEGVERAAGRRERHVRQDQLERARALRAGGKRRGVAARRVAVASADLGDVGEHLVRGGVRRRVGERDLDRVSGDVVDLLGEVLDELLVLVIGGHG